MSGKERGPVFGQALLVAPERRRYLKISEEIIPKEMREQLRQSRIVLVFDEQTGEVGYYPAQPGEEVPAVIFDRDRIGRFPIDSAHRERTTLKTARKQKTTVNLSGMEPLQSTHRPDQVEPAKPGLPLYKLRQLASGGWFSQKEREYYQNLLGQLESEIEKLSRADLADEVAWE